MTAVADNQTWRDVSNIQFYSDDSYLASIQGQPQMSTQVAVNIEKLYVDPSKIYIDSISKTKFYECYNKKLNYAHWTEMTVNQTFDVSENQIFIPYNGIGDWCVDSTTQVTFQTTGRQPFHPADNKNKYCYDNMQENVLVIFDQITGRDQINYVTYNTGYSGLCRKMSNGKVKYQDSTVVGYRKADKDEDYVTNAIKIESYKPEWENSLWVYVAFTSLSGVLFLLCLGYQIYVGVTQKDWQKAFLFKQ